MTEETDRRGQQVDALLFLSRRGDKAVLAPPYMRTLWVRKDGTLDAEATELHSAAPMSEMRRFNEESYLLEPLLLTLSFLHCKNVTRREVAQPAFEQRTWRAKHKRPLVRYHVLDIEPMREVLRTEGRSDEVGLKRALHICRGHFVSYSPDKPLFGKVSGTFWKPQHIRGSKKRGLVVKDYRVNV